MAKSQKAAIEQLAATLVARRKRKKVPAMKGARPKRRAYS